MRIWATCTAAVLVFGMCGAVQAADTSPGDDAARVAVARQLLVSMGAVRNLDMVIPKVAEQMKEHAIANMPKHTELIKEVFVGVVERYRGRKSELVETIAGVYAKRLTLSELQEIAKFYDSSVGRKFTELLPSVSREAAQASQLWAQAIGIDMQTEARRELKHRGVE